MLGPYQSLWEAQATDKALRLRRGGGIVTSLLVYALQQGLIDEAAVITASDRRPWAQPILARTPAEVMAAAGSKYALVSYGPLVQQLGARSALVGLPCQLRAYRQRPFCKLGLFCGLNLAPRGLDYLLRQLGVDPEQVATLDYRAPEVAGLLVTLKDGRQVRYGSYAWLAYFFSYKGCLRCTDLTNHHADIAVGDRRPGWSSVIVRTARGASLWQAALEAGVIQATPLDEASFVAHLTTTYLQKEQLGGFSTSRWVRVRGRWIEWLPLPVLKRVGRLIFRDARRQQRTLCATPSSDEPSN
jgi:coenzyme F420 hydrogenase subunit beta